MSVFVLTSIFAVDIGINFFLAYVDPGQVRKGCLALHLSPLTCYPPAH